MKMLLLWPIRSLGGGLSPSLEAQGNEKISAMIQKYRAETIDIEDVEFEEVDLEFDTLFPDPKQDTDNGGETSVPRIRN
ncbi:MAG: hypothetical protein NC097_01245 [Clostridium sp.]|nr:hypothetical protein [Clostridium sp.]MCM1474879.1 hypothetical protein [Muribaculaceae bacterium]